MRWYCVLWETLIKKNKSYSHQNELVNKTHNYYQSTKKIVYLNNINSVLLKKNLIVFKSYSNVKILKLINLSNLANKNGA